MYSISTAEQVALALYAVATLWTLTVIAFAFFTPFGGSTMQAIGFASIVPIGEASLWYFPLSALSGVVIAALGWQVVGAAIVVHTFLTLLYIPMAKALRRREKQYYYLNRVMQSNPTTANFGELGA